MRHESKLLLCLQMECVVSANIAALLWKNTRCSGETKVISGKYPKRLFKHEIRSVRSNTRTFFYTGRISCYVITSGSLSSGEILSGFVFL
jgi:hypothetical protein